jgi:hypothetical protein
VHGCGPQWQGFYLRIAATAGLMLAVDVSAWLRPNAATNTDRLFCHVMPLAAPKIS